MKMINLVCGAFLIICFNACTNHGPDPALPNNITDTTGNNNNSNNNNNNPDSVSVITRIDESLDDGSTLFTYDSTTHRYTNWYYYYGSYNYDSSLLFYNSNGQLSSIVEKTPAGSWPYTYAQVSVYQYNSSGQLIKIFLKRQEDNPVYTATYNTDLSNPYDILSHDSLLYNASGHIIASYTLSGVPALISSSYKFYYDAANDSLLNKVEYYSVDGSGNASLSDALSFSSYDTKSNPLYNSPFRLMGLSPFVPLFHPLPAYFISSYSNKFALYSPHNCTQAAGHNIAYSYNTDGLPTQASIGVVPTNEWVRFYYRKYKN